MAQYFLTSFAAAENQSYVGRFHRDLRREVEALTGSGVDAGLARGSGTARTPASPDRRPAADAAVMVSLCSDAYYADESCGLDWSIFDRRLQLRRDALSGGPEPRVLVRWRPSDPPRGLPRASFNSAGAVADYGRIGLLGIILRPGWNTPDYTGAVREIARTVHQVHGDDLPPLPADEQDDVWPAFPAGPLDVPGQRSRPRKPTRIPAGPTVRFPRGASVNGGPQAGRPPALPADAGRRMANAARNIADQARPGGRSFYISYAEPDEDWAIWVEYQVRLLGHRTEMDVYDWQSGSAATVRRQAALQEADVVLALISPSYVRPESSTTVDWSDALRHGGPDGEPRFLPVLVRPALLPALLRGLVIASLVGLDDAAAQQTLATALAGPGKRKRPRQEPPLPSP